jgi:hypothetical protein
MEDRIQRSAIVIHSANFSSACVLLQGEAVDRTSARQDWLATEIAAHPKLLLLGIASRRCEWQVSGDSSDEPEGG